MNRVTLYKHGSGTSGSCFNSPAGSVEICTYDLSTYFNLHGAKTITMCTGHKYNDKYSYKYTIACRKRGSMLPTIDLLTNDNGYETKHIYKNFYYWLRAHPGKYISVELNEM